MDTDLDGIGNNVDTDDDNDGIPDTEEQSLGTDPLKEDTDGDGLSDKAEQDKGSNPTVADSDGDGKVDGQDNHPTTVDAVGLQQIIQWGAFGSLILFIVFMSVYAYKRERY